ncbi:MAG TPA: glycosyltransferase family 1 protein [Flavisolibacter sp.]|jgi:glycosyltransferase involved in cell wall biosynthesis|nr:glycosyltransferase family 1 protein [Flavisolibacter sp.]
MRIGIEAQRIFRPKKHGMEVVAIELIRQLQKLDKQNEYVLFIKPDVDKEAVKETSNFKIKMIPAFTYPVWEQIKLPGIVKNENIDFLHCTSNTAPLKNYVPLLLTLHDIIYLEKIDFKGTSYQNFGNIYRRFIVKRIIGKAQIITTVSHWEKQRIIERFKLPEEKVEVIYNAVNAMFNNNFTESEILNFKEKFQLPEKFILFLGNTAPKKNTYNVIRGFVHYCRSLKTCIPLVLLDYDKSLVERILVELNAMHLLSSIIFPGYIPHSQMPLMYNSATLFLYPSLRESFGLPILEAMSCGLPVITSTTSSMPEVAGNAALLVDPFNYQAIAEGMATMLSNENERLTYKRKGLERAKDFTWEASAKKLLSVYYKMKPPNK